LSFDSSVLAALETVDDGVDVGLARLVAGEVGAQPIAEGNEPQQLPRSEEIALTTRIERLDLAAELQQAAADDPLAAIGPFCMVLTERSRRREETWAEALMSSSPSLRMSETRASNLGP